MNPSVILFDVNETLLDLRALRPHFARAFGDEGVAAHWFGQVLQTALVLTVIGAYADFGQVAGAALDVAAARRGRALAPADRTAILQAMRALPPHDDVVPALERLRAAGRRLATLTNSPPAVLEAQLRHSGLAAYFAQTLSVDAVRRFKPAAAVYQMAADRLGVPPAQVILVAAHDWDVAGAMAAGMRGALVRRPGVSPHPLYPPPDYAGATLVEVAERILSGDHPKGAGHP